MGSSGSGKSTMMNILACLDSQYEGTYILDGIDISKLTENQLSEIRNKKIGFIFQSFNLLPRLSALENVELPLVYSSVPKAERHKRAVELLEQQPNIAFEKLKNINFDLAELCLNHHNKDVDQKMKIFQELDDK